MTQTIDIDRAHSQAIKLGGLFARKIGNGFCKNACLWGLADLSQCNDEMRWAQEKSQADFLDVLLRDDGLGIEAKYQSLRQSILRWGVSKETIQNSYEKSPLFPQMKEEEKRLREDFERTKPITPPPARDAGEREFQTHMYQIQLAAARELYFTTVRPTPTPTQKQELFQFFLDGVIAESLDLLKPRDTAELTEFEVTQSFAQKAQKQREKNEAGSGPSLKMGAG